jgi:hypothetical protein
VVLDGFGYERDSAGIAFGPPGGIGGTQVLVQDFQLTPTPQAPVSGSVRDAVTLSPVSATVSFYGIGDPDSLTASAATSGGDFSVNLPSKEGYRVVVLPPAPYVDVVDTVIPFLGEGGVTVDFLLREAEVLLVDDDGGQSLETAYRRSVDQLGFLRRTFSTADSDSIPSAVLASFTLRPVVIWFTGVDSVDVLTADERSLLQSHLDAGGRLILSGQNIAQTSAPDDSFLAGTLGVRFGGTSAAARVQGFAGDVIGNGVLNWLMSGGSSVQNSKDILEIVPGTTALVERSLYWMPDTLDLAAVRVTGPSTTWAAVVFGFGTEGLSPARQDTLIARSMRFFAGTLVSVGGAPFEGIPAAYELGQNYPNPFNPVTTIRYGVPVAGRVLLDVYDIAGRRIRTLVDGDTPAGYHSVEWDGRNDAGVGVASGVYMMVMRGGPDPASGPVLTGKMLLLR